MGRSEWGVLVRSQADVDTANQLVKQHNESPSDIKGEDLTIRGAIRFKGQVFLCIGNGGGEGYSTQFLNANKPAHMTILWPFDKPAGWIECQEYLWQRQSKTCVVNVPGLPDTADNEIIRGLEPREPPSRTPRDDFFDMLEAVLPAMVPGARVIGRGYRPG